MGCHRHHASRARWTDLLLHFVRHSSCKTQATHNTLREKGEKGIDQRGFNCLCRRRSFFFSFHSSILSVRGLIVKGNNLLSLLLSFFYYYFSTLLFLSQYLYCRFCSFLALFMLTKGVAGVGGVNDVVTTTLSVRIPFRQRAIPKKKKKKGKKIAHPSIPLKPPLCFAPQTLKCCQRRRHRHVILRQQWARRAFMLTS